MKCPHCGKEASPKRKARKSAYHWPPPTYVASYANGEVARMSFAAPAGKPLNWAAVRLQASQHLPIKDYSNPAYPLGIPSGAYVPLVSLDVEGHPDSDQAEAAE